MGQWLLRSALRGRGSKHACPAWTVVHGSLCVLWAGGEAVTLSLEVIAGPAAGTRLTRKAEGDLDAGPSVSVGRVKANDLPLNDSEVSSRHALISWNYRGCRWELADRGSLNGTLLNDRLLTLPSHQEGPAQPERDGEGKAEWAPEAREGSTERPGTAQAVPLSDGDIITCGQSSRILVCASLSCLLPATASLALGLCA